MPPRNARGHAKSLTGARGARGVRRACRNHENHQESAMGGGASAPGGNVGGAPPTTLGGAEFMQGVFTAIEQVVRNTVQTMQVPVRTAESRATTDMKTFLQLRPPTFKGEPDPLVAEDWLEQVTRALDTNLVTEEDLRVMFASYQLQGDALQWWKTMEEVVAKKWEPFKKAFLDQYFTDTAKEALRMEFINLVQGSMTVAQYEAKFTSLSRFAKAFVSTEEEKVKQFMRGLRPFIRNKIAGNLIKVYSTMVSAAAAIEETLNETRNIQNPKSQHEGISNQSEGRSSKKPRNSTAQQQYLTRSSPATFGYHPDKHLRDGRFVLVVINLASRATPAFTSAQTTYQSRPTSCSSTGLEDTGTSLCYNIRNGTVGDSWIAGAAIGYLYCARSTLKRVCRSCEVEIADRRFVFDFIVLDMTSFDVILGMDWLTGYRAMIDLSDIELPFVHPREIVFIS
ncbi:hypothetical protein Acr_00g0086290 [Actinidia rufa]|uniref:Retrotransposon gag domain-containing protein n=1 Tax=Actinidia rufa TaxID=165716 RepID=A0A7J0DVR5_9ERIC|nr:hypothetical protein Acr_00g0086290 [Actinidia rufa]